MKNYLEATNVIDYLNENIQKLSKKLSKGLTKDIDIARECFIYVRDNIKHSGDLKSDVSTCKASEVLEYKTGWCFAKSHLLCALLRANNIPVSIFSCILLSKNTCIKKILKIIGNNKSNPVILVFGIIINIPAKI